MKITQHMVQNIDGTMGHKIKTKTWNTVRYLSTQQIETQHTLFKKMRVRYEK